MSGLVEKFLNTPIPENVWHYTTVAGLEGIVASSTVWATEAHHTTDPSEFVHARALATAFLQKIKPADESFAYAKQAGLNAVAHAFDAGTLSQGKTQIFVASFSSSQNLNSQWKEYADLGRGVSIAFDLRNIRPPAKIGSVITFAPCVYIQDEKENLIKAALGDFIDTVAELHQGTGSQCAAQHLRDWSIDHQIFGLGVDSAAFDTAMIECFQKQLHGALTRTAFDLLRLASHCKSYKFHQECEWRISLPRFKDKQLTKHQILYRDVNQNTPYLAHNLFQARLPITQVLVGPQCRDIEKIQRLLDAHGYQVPVVKV